MSDRSVVWITLESVRQDHTAIGEYNRDTTPNLRRLANEEASGAFTNCFAHGIWTRTSTASILTGRAPGDHNVLSDDDRLSDEIPTIPEALSNHGYRTAAVSPIAQVSDATSLDRGFDYFNYLSRHSLLEEIDFQTLLGYLFNIRKHSGGLTRDTRRHCTGYLTTALAKDHIQAAARANDPLFLYVHLADSHHAYYPPRGWRSRFETDLEVTIEEALSIALDMSERLLEHVANGAPFTQHEWNALEVLYDMTLSYVDHLASQIEESAREQLDDPIVVITADHGELFGESGCLAHMLVANTAVSNVPLVVSGLDGIRGLSGELIQHSDVFEMIGNDCELPITVPAGKDIREEPRSTAVTQRGGKRARQKIAQMREYNPEFDASRYHEGDLTSVVSREYRYQQSDAGHELFARPDETTDISDEQPDVTERFQERCESWLAEHTVSRGDTEDAEFSEEMEQQLRELGYL